MKTNKSKRDPYTSFLEIAFVIETFILIMWAICTQF